MDDPVLEAQVIETLPAEWRPCPPEGSEGRFGLTRSGLDGYHVTVDGTPGIEHATLDVALGMLESQLEQFMALHAVDWVFIHSGAVAYNGRALLIPGESFSGKTTLVAALVEAGATYYSDEFAVLDPDGRLHSYGRRLSIRSEDRQLDRQLHARELGGVTAQEAATVGAVAVTRYRPGGRWQPRRLSPAQGLAALMGLTVPAQERPAESMQTLRRALASATIVESERGEARLAADALLTLLAG